MNHSLAPGRRCSTSGVTDVAPAAAIARTVARSWAGWSLRNGITGAISTPHPTPYSPRVRTTSRRRRIRDQADQRSQFHLSRVRLKPSVAVRQGWLEEREIDGRRYLLEDPIKGDYALIGAHVADAMGNLVYRKTARNFGPVVLEQAESIQDFTGAPRV
jgi:hypothetical protein